MLYHVYCPCNVKTKGLLTLGKNPDCLMQWFIWSWIYDGDKRASCKHCGDILKIADDKIIKKYLK